MTCQNCNNCTAKHTSAPAPEPDQIVVCPQSCVCKPGNCKHKLPHKYSEGCNEGSDTKCDVCSDCSSPHTPAPGKPRPPCEECVYQARSVEHDAQVAKAEREQIIKELESWNPFQRTFGNVLEALRQPDPQQTTCHPRYGRNTRTGLEKTDNETRRSNEQLSGIGKDCS